MAADVRRVKEVFLTALEQSQAAARGAVLDRECGTDLELQQRVEALLRANDQPDDVFDQRIDAQPECIDTVSRQRVKRMLSDSEILRSTDGILSRLSRTGMSVVASTQAVGWRDIHGVITDGRLEDFFDYSAPFHIVAFNLKGDPTVEWKRGSQFSRFQAQPGELLITPSGEGHSIRQLRPNVAFHCCLSPDRLQSLAEQEWNTHGSRIEIVEACCIPIPFLSIIAEVTVMILGFFMLFELSKWQTYLIVLLNFAVLFGAHYVMANYINHSRSFGSRPQSQFSEMRTRAPNPPVVLCDDRESGLGDRDPSRTDASVRRSAIER